MRSGECLSFFWLYLSMAGCIIYLYGYFPQSDIWTGSQPTNYSSLSNRTSFRQLNTSVKLPRVVLMVIDAYRWDFPSLPEAMPFVSALVQRRACLQFICEVHVPTVTMPRIKALLTGTVPQYLDVVNNYRAQPLNIDSWFAQMRRHGDRIVFYGDNTWMKLVDGGMFDEESKVSRKNARKSRFHRSHGLSSFDVTDYTDVDSNVTFHLRKELPQPTATLPTSHAGPDGSRDLLDWDMMILHYLGLDHIGHMFSSVQHPLIEQKLQQMDSIIRLIYERLSLIRDPAIILVCGDHGMVDTGGHGGASYDETHVAVQLIPINMPLPTSTPSSASSVRMADLSSTLSVLRGVPVPARSRGRVLPLLLDLLEPRHRVWALASNLHTLLSVVNTSSAQTHLIDSYGNLPGLWIDSGLVGVNYSDDSFSGMSALADLISQRLALHSEVHYGYLYMCVGMICVCMGLLFSTYPHRSRLRLICSNVMRHAASSRRLGYLVVSTLLHLVSLLSTSYIEKEHVTCHFLLTTCLLLGACHSLPLVLLTCVLAHPQVHAATIHHRLAYMAPAIAAYVVLCRERLSACSVYLLLAGLWLRARHWFAWCVLPLLVSHSSATCTQSSHHAPRQAAHTALLFHWMSMWAHYHVTGNTNLPSTVDIGVGYSTLLVTLLLGGVQVTDFAALCLTFLNTFSAYVFVLLKAFSCLAVSSVHCLLVLRITTTLVYMGVAMLHSHHLFVWSVFAPKLLYELCLCVICILLATVTISIRYLHSVVTPRYVALDDRLLP